MDAATPVQPVQPLEYFGSTTIPTAVRAGTWREGAVLSTFEDSALPGGGVRCGRSAAPRVDVRLACLPLHMRPVASFAFVLLGFARRVRIKVGLCARCRARAAE